MTRLKFNNALDRSGGWAQTKDQIIKNFEYSYDAEITNLYPLTTHEKLYQIQLLDPEQRRRFSFRPGQFIMLEVPGVGEAPFSISSSSLRRGYLELCIRAVGNLTRFLDRMARGVQVGISGPFGTSFPVEKMEGHNVILLAGGLGIVPLRAPLFSVLENRSRYGAIDIIYGAKKPAELLFTYQYAMWRQFDINLQITVDEADDSWSGPVGLVTEILRRRINASPDFAESTYVIACGPPIMFKSVCEIVMAAGLPMNRMFVSLERRMHCGRGKCCRCNIGSTYTCLDGPVFDYWTVLNLKEAI